MTPRISSAGAEGTGEAEPWRGPWPAEWDTFSPDARRRLERLLEASPLYSGWLAARPSLARWLEEPRNLRTDYRYGAVVQEWAAYFAAEGSPSGGDEARLALLRRWRRQMSLRIAYRSVNGLAPESTAAAELTRVAEFCIRECLALASRRAAAGQGQPWDEALDRPARLCVVALGKLGGAELNFSSDVDLLFVYDGEGCCRRDGRPGPFANVEHFTRVAEALSTALGAQTADGFLFRVDARLRPEGAAGPLVRSLTSLENYYAVAGQTWERLALLRARPVAGDLALGFELLESLQSFRYPRNPPPSLLEDVALTKARTEREVVGAGALERDVKSGYGGIREVEFIVQGLQLRHAGRYPFLQTHSTDTALDQLVRYALLPAVDAGFLREAYWFLRQVEHRLQIREERQTHRLPESAGERERLARSLGFPGLAAFEERLGATRRRVRELFAAMYQTDDAGGTALADWWTFLSSPAVPPAIAGKLQRWFGADPSAAPGLRLFASGSASHVITREQVLKFEHLAASFDDWMPQLAAPRVTLGRLARFAERYGSRNHFFGACAENPAFLRALALLFDRSTFVHELLCTHPEILEEVMRPEILRQRKDAGTLERELSGGPAEPASHARWLPLYLRAEQVRYTVAELLGLSAARETEAALTRLADAALRHVCRRIGGLERLLIVALGSYGGGELAFGSDLDVVWLAAEDDTASLEAPLREALRLLRGQDALGVVLQLDARLRPHGEAGPLIATVASYQRYHDTSAQFWERQLLTRARIVTGPQPLQRAWTEWTGRAVYSPPATDADWREAWRMRRRIEAERGRVDPPERAFKAAAGGLVDHEFLVQLEQLRFGGRWTDVRQPATREGLAALVRRGVIEPPVAAELSEHYEFLKRVETVARRDGNLPMSTLPVDCGKIAVWLGFPNEPAFLAEHRTRMSRSRDLVLNLLFGGVDPL